jgi:transposase-like protein
MSMAMDEDIKRWTAQRKAPVVLEIIQGKTSVVDVSRQFGLTQSEIEEWLDQGKSGMENALKAKPEDIREQ